MQEVRKKKKEMKQLVFKDWYYFGRYSEINAWLIDVKNLVKKKRDKILNDIYCKQINFRKKKLKGINYINKPKSIKKTIKT